jgi:acetyl esterase/lipase
MMTLKRASSPVVLLICICTSVVFALDSDPRSEKKPTASAPAQPQSRRVTFQEVLQMPFSKPSARIHYGQEPLQFADLRIPQSKGPHPIAVLIHGGCWTAEIADNRYFNAMADALTKKGIATYNIEYRRIGDKGGGWPGTFLDVAHATDHLRDIASEYNLDLSRVIVVGHSAGGHLALWTAARHKLPKTSELYTPDPLKILAAVNLAGPGDLSTFTPTDKHACGDAVEKLLGGKPGEVPQRYLEASPTKQLPLGVRQLCIAGADDNLVPPVHIRTHADAAKKAGDVVEFIEVKDAGHFDLISPRSAAWADVEQAVLIVIKK